MLRRATVALLLVGCSSPSVPEDVDTVLAADHAGRGRYAVSLFTPPSAPAVEVDAAVPEVDAYVPDPADAAQDADAYVSQGADTAPPPPPPGTDAGPGITCVVLTRDAATAGCPQDQTVEIIKLTFSPDANGTWNGKMCTNSPGIIALYAFGSSQYCWTGADPTYGPGHTTVLVPHTPVPVQDYIKIDFSLNDFRPSPVPGCGTVPAVSVSCSGSVSQYR